MCPACMASAGLMLATVVSTGGLTAFIVRVRSQIAGKKVTTEVTSKEKIS